MRRLLLPAAALCAAALALPTSASAEIIEIGKVDPAVPSSCPGDNCLALAVTTGYQAKVGTTRAPMVVPKDGRIVALTVGLGKPSQKQIDFFMKSPYRFGTASVQLTILDPRTKLRYRAIRQSETFKVEPFFGRTVQFPLARTLPVKKGQVVAITSRTWAPILATADLGNDTSWRASRAKGSCDNAAAPTAQVQPNQLTQYYCLYGKERLNYSATLITTPTVKKTTKKSARRR